MKRPYLIKDLNLNLTTFVKSVDLKLQFQSLKLVNLIFPLESEDLFFQPESGDLGIYRFYVKRKTTCIDR